MPLPSLLANSLHCCSSIRAAPPDGGTDGNTVNAALPNMSIAVAARACMLPPQDSGQTATPSLQFSWCRRCTIAACLCKGSAALTKRGTLKRMQTNAASLLASMTANQQPRRPKAASFIIFHRGRAGFFFPLALLLIKTQNLIFWHNIYRKRNCISNFPH
jgi:hypothetical protein